MKYKTKVAVGITGRIVVLEKFPDDEKHAGLEDMLKEIETDVETDDAPGIYMATFYVTTTTMRDPSDDVSYLEIDHMSPIHV